MSHQIIKLLKGSSPQNPVQFNALVDKSGLLPKTLTMILDTMYERHSINQAMVTRNGVEQREVWLTGMAEKPLIIKPSMAPPYRRNEAKPIVTINQPEVQMTALPVKTTSESKADTPVTEAAPQSDKPKALAILEFIEFNPGCTSQQIMTALNLQAPQAYIKFHIKRGNVIVELGHSRQNKYTLKDGMTATEIYGGGNRHAPIRNAVKAVKPVPASIKPSTEISQLIEIDATHLAPPHCDPLVVPSKQIKDTSAAHPQFRVAYTSDGCLIIMGVQFMPIELDAAQTRELINYVDDMKLSEVA